MVREETIATRRLVAVGRRNPEDRAAASAFAFKEAQQRKATLLAIQSFGLSCPTGCREIACFMKGCQESTMKLEARQ